MQQHALFSLTMTYMESSGVFWPDTYLANISLTRGPCATLPKSTGKTWGRGYLLCLMQVLIFQQVGTVSGGLQRYQILYIGP